MSSSNDSRDTWGKHVEAITSLQSALRRSKAVNVNTKALRGAAKELVQGYFRETRPDLVDVGVGNERIGALDSQMQTLLGLANGARPKSSYLTTLSAARKTAEAVELERELLLGERRRPLTSNRRTDVEIQIITTLTDLAPTAARSYEQAISDLDDAERQSFRGPAHELREALREALDRLAPDDAVKGTEWFAPEGSRSKPTQRQKMRYILQSRGLSASARKTPEQSVTLIEELTASVMRSSYERTSVAAHVASSKAEVLQMKMYVDSVLAEILEVHAAG